MALSDLISRPLTAPLEGFDKAVGVGFELAQRQDQLRIANEQLALRKEEIQSEYLTKGITALSGLSKSKGPARKMMSQLIESYFSRAGLKINPDALTFISSDDDNIQRISQVAEALKEESPVLRKLKLQQIFGADGEELPELMKSIDIQEQAKVDVSKALSVEAAKQTFQSEVKRQEREQEAKTEREKALLAEKTIPLPIARKAMTLPEELRTSYVTTFNRIYGNSANQILEDIKSMKGGNPAKAANIVKILQEGHAVYPTNPDKANESLQKAQGLFAEFQASIKPAEKVSGEKLGKLSDTQIEKFSAASQAPSIFDDMEKTIKNNQQYFGPIVGRLGRIVKPIGMQPDDFGKVMAFADLVKQKIAKPMEGGVLREADEKKYDRMLPRMEDTPNVALGKLNQLRSMVFRDAKAFYKSMERAKKDVSAYKDILSLPDVEMEITKGKKTESKEQKPATQSAAPKGVIPFSKLQERAKAKNKSIDSLLKDAESQGYQIDRSR